MRRLYVVLTAACIALAGCQTYDPYTGEEKVSNTAKGAGIGAGIGAVIAYIANKDESSKTRKRRTLQAAGIGALAGGAVGYYMDRQEAELRKQLRGTGVRVEREGDNINLIMPGNITFVTAGHDLNADFYEVLNSVVLVLQEFDQTLIVVAGHTDSRGSDDYNQALSERRADSVARYMLARDVVEARIETVGFGEKVPLASNENDSGRAQNRRVELSLLPITEES